MTDAALPEPLVPAEVDLRDFDYMPLYGRRLLDSDTWAICDADEKVAALSLWWSSWHEEPAGSLTDNDRVLAKAAGYGVAVKEFLRVKENAMRGWIRCADGRLYHPVVASLALEVWQTKRRKKSENEADRERKRRKRAALSGRTPADCPPENALKGEGKKDPVASPPPPRAADTPTKPVDLVAEQPDFLKRSKPQETAAAQPQPDESPLDLKAELWRRGVAFLAKHGVAEARARPLIGKWRKLAGDVDVLNALARAEAECASDPIAFIEGVFRHAKRNGAQRPQQGVDERRAAILQGLGLARGERSPPGDDPGVAPAGSPALAARGGSGPETGD